MLDVNKLIDSIRRHEGTILYVYDDANGRPIIKGYTVIGNPTIGTGRLLTSEKGISQVEANTLLSTDIQSAIGAATAQIWWPAVADNDARSRAMVEIVYNLGIGGVSGFHDALAAMERSDWSAAAAGFLDSLWRQQVGQRAEILAAMILNGSD